MTATPVGQPPTITRPAVAASAALAGEVTGNGKNLQIDGGKWGTNLHSRSLCAYSGQEDLQFFNNEEGNTDPKAEPTRGDPAHAQSWGQIPKDFRDFLTSIGHNPGIACNPTHAGAEE